MSFILDALKKSELERQRQSTPGLIEMPAAARRRGVPVWVWVLVGLLCVNVAFLLILLLRSGSAGTAASRPEAARNSSPVPAPVPAPAAAAPAADHFSPMDTPPVYAPEIPVQEDVAGSLPDPSMPKLDAPPRAVPPLHAARHTDAGHADAGRPDPVLNDDPPDDDEMLPSISELNLTGNQSLPDIHLDVHVYASRPADRFVYINMRKYREGAVLQEGPTLERIRRDGVILNYNGLRFLVPRQ
jgi:general secretion pathway protein B